MDMIDQLFLQGPRFPLKPPTRRDRAPSRRVLASFDMWRRAHRSEEKVRLTREVEYRGVDGYRVDCNHGLNLSYVRWRNFFSRRISRLGTAHGVLRMWYCWWYQVTCPKYKHHTYICRYSGFKMLTACNHPRTDLKDAKPVVYAGLWQACLL